jgi:hypothetical protein
MEGRWLPHLRSAEVLLATEVHDEHVRWLHKFFLHTARRNVDLVFIPDAGSSASTCNLAMLAC